MNKSFESLSGMSYGNQNFEESSWDKMRKGVRCYAGWGGNKKQKTQQQNPYWRTGNYNAGSAEDLLARVEEKMNTQEKAFERGHKYIPRPIVEDLEQIERMDLTSSERSKLEQLKRREKTLQPLQDDIFEKKGYLN